MLPNLLDDLLRSWDGSATSPGALPAETTEAPLVEANGAAPEPPVSVVEEVHLPVLQIAAAVDPHPLIPAPETLLPAEPFLAFTQVGAESGTTSTAMDSLLSNLLLHYGGDAETPLAAIEPPAPTRPLAALPPVTPRTREPFTRAFITPPGNAQAIGKKYVAVTVGGDRFALPIELVLEAGSYPNVTFVPGLAPYVKGVFSFRGEVVPVIDVAILAGSVAASALSLPTETARIVTLQSANGQNKAAFVFDSIEGIVSIDSEALDAKAAQQYPLTRALAGVCRLDAARFGMISADRLLEEAGCIETVTQ